jgi:hypothetical protein
MLHKTGKYLKIFVASNRIIFDEIEKSLGPYRKISPKFDQIDHEDMAPKYINVQGSFGKKKTFLNLICLTCWNVWTFIGLKVDIYFFQSTHKISVCSWFATIYINFT